MRSKSFLGESWLWSSCFSSLKANVQRNMTICAVSLLGGDFGHGHRLLLSHLFPLPTLPGRSHCKATVSGNSARNWLSSAPNSLRSVRQSVISLRHQNQQAERNSPTSLPGTGRNTLSKVILILPISKTWEPHQF